ncbi:hypothetical protein OAE73_00365 [bacterium]|nr:hypothetical protein [bacterium]
MEFRIFKNKKISKSEDKLYLAQPTMLFSSLDPSDYLMLAQHTVKDDDIVRPDRISMEHYGTVTDLDIILKFNGISDPFSMLPGETLWIPVDSIPYFKLESPEMYEDNPIKNQFIQTKRLSKIDQRRVEALKKKYNKESLLPPNVIPVGKKNYEFDGTDVRLGMHAQTDPVVNSILSDIKNSNNDSTSQSNYDSRNNTDGDSLTIDTSDNSLSRDSVNGGNSNGGNSNGGNSNGGNSNGEGLPNNDNNSNFNNSNNSGAGKLYDNLLVKNSGKFNKSGSNNSSGVGGGTGSGTGGGTGSKSDRADILGGNKPDGSAPLPKGNNPTSNSSDTDSPCSK